MNLNVKNASLNKFDHKIISQLSEHIIFKFDLTEINPDLVANNIRTLLKDRIRRDKTNATRKGFHVTDTEIFTKETNHLFDDLLEVVESKVLDIVNTINAHAASKLADVKPVVETFWGALYQKGDSAGWHYHQDIYCYQAVYYADVSDDTPIIFKNELGKNLEIKPTKGSLIVFSGKTNHMVPAITSDNTRLVLATNLIYKASK